MSYQIRDKSLGKIFTVLKDGETGLVKMMCDENRCMKVTKFVKEINVNSIENDDFLIKRKHNEFNEEIKSWFKDKPSHPQILNPLTYDFYFDKEEEKLVYIIYYNEQKLLSLAQYFYIYKDSNSKIIDCFYKIGCLLKELSEIAMLKLSFLNIYVNDKEEIVLIVPPFSFFQNERMKDEKDPNLTTILPPEPEEKMTPDKYYSFLFGICMVRAMGNKMFKSTIKKLSQNSSNIYMDPTLDFAKYIALPNMKEIFSNNLISLIQECLKYDILSRISIKEALFKYATIMINKIDYHLKSDNYFSSKSNNSNNSKAFILFPNKEHIIKNNINSPNVTIFTARTKVWMIQNLKESLNFENRKTPMKGQINLDSLNDNNMKTTKEQNYLSKKSEMNSILNNTKETNYENIKEESFDDQNQNQSQFNQNVIDFNNTSNPKEYYINNKSQNRPEPLLNELNKTNEKIIDNSFNDKKEINDITLEKNQLKTINLSQHQKEMTPKIVESFNNLKEIFDLPNEINEDQKSEQNNVFQVSDLYNQIMKKLNDLNASSITMKTLSNIFYLDVRDLNLSEENLELQAFKEIIKLNSLVQNIIINQYDFTRLIYEGRSNTLKADVQKKIFEKIQHQEGFKKFIFGTIN